MIKANHFENLSAYASKLFYQFSNNHTRDVVHGRVPVIKA